MRSLLHAPSQTVSLYSFLSYSNELGIGRQASHHRDPGLPLEVFPNACRKQVLSRLPLGALKASFVEVRRCLWHSNWKEALQMRLFHESADVSGKAVRAAIDPFPADG